MKKEISNLLYEVNKGYTWKGDENYGDLLLVNKFSSYKLIMRKIKGRQFGIELFFR
jgi:hypothetical protein